MLASRPWRGATRKMAADDGNAALELLILAPVILALIGLVIAAGRTSVAQGSVDAAARDAARQASISLTAGAAREAALVERQRGPARRRPALQAGGQVEHRTRLQHPARPASPGQRLGQLHGSAV